MDRLIRMAWRTFWVGLGASAVLIGQTLAQPSEPELAPAPRLLVPAEPVGTPTPVEGAPARPRSSDPILSRNPFDTTTGPLGAPVCAGLRRC